MGSTMWLDKCSNQSENIKSEIKIMVAVDSVLAIITTLTLHREDYTLQLLPLVCGEVQSLYTYGYIHEIVHVQDR